MPGVGFIRPAGGGAGGGGSVSVEVSNTAPDFGDVITIDATATGFTPDNYLFFARQGSEVHFIGENATGTIDWTVDFVGEFSVFVQADNGSLGAFNVGGNTVTSAQTIVTSNLQLWLDPFRSNVVAPSYPDLSGLSRDGTLVNSPTFVAGTLDPNGGGYVELNGINQAIENIGSISDFSFIQNTRVFTVAAWIYVTDLVGENWIFGNTASSTEKGSSLRLTSVGGYTKALRFQLWNGVAGQVKDIYTNDNIITSVGWNYVAITMNGTGTEQFYLNGTPITTNATGSDNLPTGNSSRTLSVGRTTGFSSYFTGRIAPVQIYDRALSGADVTQNFDADKARYGL